MWQLLSLIALIGAPLELVRRVEATLPPPPPGAPPLPPPTDLRPAHPKATAPAPWTDGRAYHGVSNTATADALGKDIWTSKRASLNDDVWVAVRGGRGGRAAAGGGAAAVAVAAGGDACDLGGPLMRPLPRVAARRETGEVRRVTVRSAPGSRGERSRCR
ncbi:hypothetical protein BU14_0400s0014 [Porphyra umbilicalis]|uniref:Uncharacterized protein n=1 Tax=Porphyra umbilicalis TaxID=2786 RepID=A0A1X6NWC8_PORUM|nr:hypothetical protein BU14_0400s0014 [Porphyra umbilicalis]|eukprot:OSX72855.1 hypothetical protein BU14_0400s0014 [Porphyra umbilicalis]